MARNGADYTLTFRGLCGLVDSSPDKDRAIRSLFGNSSDFDDWEIRWRKRLSEDKSDPARCQEAMVRGNPAYIPRNHLVEEAINSAIDDADFSNFEKLISVLSSPYEEHPDCAKFAASPRPEQIVRATFCGT